MCIINTDDLLFDAISFAREAGRIQLDKFRKGDLGAQAKINNSDIVTLVDKASEESIIGNIQSKYPTHSILSEEAGEHFKSNSDYEWVIDPLDGTTNYNAGLPIFSVSIAIKHHNETLIGVVYAPYLNELFHAIKGEGAYLNGNKISVSQTTVLEKAVVGTGFPVDKMLTTDNNVDNFRTILPLTRAIRRLGSAAIDISYVAAGIFDAFWEINLHEWDVQAALLIAKEAGAEYEFFRSDRNISVLVGNPTIKKCISPLLSRMPG